MKKLTQRALRLFGLELNRVKPSKRISVDAEEVARLEQILRDFADKQPAGSELNFEGLRSYLNNSRIFFFQELVGKIETLKIDFSNKEIADFGCGSGYLLRLIEKHSNPRRLHGFDTFLEVNELARQICPSATFTDQRITEINDHFDLIFCTQVLEHTVDPGVAVKKMISCLTSGGSLVLTVPNGRTDQQSAGKIREDGTAYWGHIHFWSPESWLLFLESNSSSNVRVQTAILPTGQNLGVLTHFESKA